MSDNLPPRPLPLTRLAAISGRPLEMVRRTLLAEKVRATEHAVDCGSAIAWLNKHSDYRKGKRSDRVCQIHILISQPTMQMLNKAHPGEFKTTIILKALGISARLAAYTNLLMMVKPPKVKKRFHKTIINVDKYDWMRAKVLAYCCKVSASDVVDFAIRFYLSNVENIKE